MCECGLGRRGGFTLIEVNLAILLIATGMLVLLALFPQGMHENEEAIKDTHESMFAAHILSGLEGNALSQRMMDWDVWITEDSFRAEICREVNPVDGVNTWDRRVDGVIWPDSTESRIRYRLQVAPVEDTGNRLWTANLQVKSGVYGDFEAEVRSYVTSFVYLGDLTWRDAREK